MKEGGRTLSALILFIFSILLNFWDNLLSIPEISEVLFFLILVQTTQLANGGPINGTQ